MKSGKQPAGLWVCPTCWLPGWNLWADLGVTSKDLLGRQGTEPQPQSRACSWPWMETHPSRLPTFPQSTLLFFLVGAIAFPLDLEEASAGTPRLSHDSVSSVLFSPTAPTSLLVSVTCFLSRYSNTVTPTSHGFPKITSCKRLPPQNVGKYIFCTVGS